MPASAEPHRHRPPPHPPQAASPPRRRDAEEALPGAGGGDRHAHGVRGHARPRGGGRVRAYAAGDHGTGHRIAGKKLVVVPVLRAGLGMVEGVLRLIPGARVGHVGMSRDEESLQPVEYYFKVPARSEVRRFVVVDPMLATGGIGCGHHIGPEGTRGRPHQLHVPGGRARGGGGAAGPSAATFPCSLRPWTDNSTKTAIFFQVWVMPVTGYSARSSVQTRSEGAEKPRRGGSGIHPATYLREIPGALPRPVSAERPTWEVSNDRRTDESAPGAGDRRRARALGIGVRSRHPGAAGHPAGHAPRGHEPEDRAG